VVGATTDAISLTQEVVTSTQTGDWENTAKEGTRIATSWALAAAWGKGGAALGFTLGGTLGTAVPVIGNAVGAAAGTVVGGLVGGVAGYMAGSEAVNQGWSYAKSGYNSVKSWFGK
jgi:hypothetical protein